MKCEVKITLNCLQNGMSISVFVPTTTSTTTTQEPCFIVDCEGNVIIDCECNQLSCGNCIVECYVEDCNGNFIADCLGDTLSCIDCASTSSTTTLFPPTTSSTTTSSNPGTTSTTTTVSGFDQSVVEYMFQLGIPYNNTVYYEGTPQERTGQQLWEIVSNLVEDLKDNGIWDKTLAIYPYLGGTQFRHSINLRNPANTNSAKRLVFNGTWTHSATGVTPTSITSYADTFIRLSDDNPQYSFTGATYMRTLGVSPPNSFYVFGSGANLGVGYVFMLLNQNGTYNITAGTPSVSITGSAAPISYTGLLTMTCFRDNVFRFYKNSTLIASNSNPREVYFDGYRPMDFTGTLYLGATGFNGVLQPQVAINSERAFDYIGKGMDTAQQSAFNSAIAAYQTALNRNV